MDGSIEGAGTGSRKAFWLFCLAGFVLVLSGAASLRLERTVKAMGHVQAADEVYVYAPATGRLEIHHARIGQAVEAGDPLFSLDRTDLDLRILSRRQELTAAHAEIAAVEAALRLADLRPADPSLLTAPDRMKLLEEIRSIQREMLAAWEKLEGERAVRAIDYSLQRVAALRTEVEQLETRLLHDWMESGLPSLERAGLEERRQHLSAKKAGLEEELRLLGRMAEERTVTAPRAGTVADIYARYPGMAVEEGRAVLKLVDTSRGYRVKAYVGERNIDLFHIGMPTRMASRVFDSLFEGYVYGTVRRVVADAARSSGPSSAEAPLYEVTVEVESTPYPLVLGSGMEVEFLLGRQSILGMLLQRPDPARDQPGEEPR